MMRIIAIAVLMASAGISWSDGSDKVESGGNLHGYPFDYASNCIETLLREDLLKCEDETHYQLNFELWKHPAMPFVQLSFSDGVHVLPDVGRDYVCYFDRESEDLVSVLKSRGRHDSVIRDLLDRSWRFEDFSDEQWEEFSFGKNRYKLRFRIDERIWDEFCDKYPQGSTSSP